MSILRYTILIKILERLGIDPTPRGNHLRCLVRIFAVVLICLVLNTLSFYHFERQHGHAVSLFDSVWFSATTITTVGYGDEYPRSVAARVATMALMYLVGIACLPYAVAHFLAYFDVVRDLKVAGMCDNRQNDCLIVVHFPNSHWITTLIAEVRAEPGLASIPIWIIDPVVEQLPEDVSSLPDVHFIHGNTIDLETYRRANAVHARFVVVLPREPALSDTDAATSTVVRVIRSVTDARIIPVRVDGKNEHLFEGFRGLVPGDFPMKVAAQELTDLYVARGVDRLMSNREGALPLSMEISRLAGRTIGQLDAALAAHSQDEQSGCRLRFLAHVRDRVPNWLPSPDEELQKGDVVILVGTERPRDWAALEEQLLSIAVDPPAAPAAP